MPNKHNKISNKIKLAFRLLKYVDAESVLKLISFKLDPANFSLVVRKLIQEEPFKSLFTNSGLDIKYFVYYIRGVLNYYPVCKKPTIRKFCSNKCQMSLYGNDPEFKLKVANGRKPRTQEQRGLQRQKMLDYWSNISDDEKQCFNNKRENTNLQRYGVKNVSFKLYKYLNKEDLNEQYIRDHFINNGVFNIKACSNHFGVQEGCTRRIKKRFNILEPSKTNSKFQNTLYEWIPVKNKIANDRSILKGKEIDILLPDHNLAIEYNGLMFHSNGYSKYARFNLQERDMYYHLNKTLTCLENNLILFHIFERESIDKWKSKICEYLGLNKKLDNFKIKEIGEDIAKNFIAKHDLNQYKLSNISLGLYKDKSLVQVLTAKDNMINNFCSKLFLEIDKSFLFNYYIEKHKFETVHYYYNRRFYLKDFEKLGFKIVNTTTPTKYYFNCEDYKLKETTEDEEKLLQAGYRVIYDCGFYRMSWSKAP